MRVLVTGATGFIGSALAARLAEDGNDIVAPVRQGPGHPHPLVRYRTGLALEQPRGWDEALEGVEAVVHCAARVHRVGDDASHLGEYRSANCEATRALAERAAEAGAKRFVFLSSVKVNGEGSEPARPFRADDPPAPADAYAISKWEAEQALFALSERTRLEVTAVRPPLVYGPGVKANFQAMMRLLWKRVPLPLASVRAKRSLIGVDNLVDLLRTTLTHSQAAGRIFLASDGEDLEVPELLRKLGAALGRPARLFPAPPRLLEVSARLLGRPGLAQRVLQPLQVDISPTRRLLDWTPPLSVEQGLWRAAADFVARQAR